jgi:uncharacterized membrane protein YgdD (TMEM256/DUF423 family)
VTSSARFGVFGAVAGFLAVAAGAFGAHALRHALPMERLSVFETAARYQALHALALIAVGFALERSRSRALTVAGWLFVVGQVLFPGSLYALAGTGASAWGAVTPAGGLCFLAGWIALAIGLARR